MSHNGSSNALAVMIVGCGQIAGGYDEPLGDAIKTHAKAFLAHGGFRLAGCVDPDRNKARRFAERWRIPAVFTEFGAALSGDYDVVSICSPPEAHAGQLRALLDADVSLVFCEKPLTTDGAVSQTLVEAYRQRNRLLAVNYQRRWEPEARRVGAEISAGRWGRLLDARGIYTKGIYANGSHLIDLLHMLLGPLTPMSVTEQRFDYSASDPSLAGLLRTADGSPVTLSLGDCRHFTIFELDLLFEAGRVTFGDSGRTLCERRIVSDPRYAGYRILEAPQIRSTGMDSTMSAAIANIYDSVTLGRELASTGQSALISQLTCRRLHAMAGEAAAAAIHG